ncbi:uncharacterized protein LOC127148571 [Cucumis melo]|uniref:Uncharacterized protein LOC127148571 n=1 Tax=Cucumis melo TaxID=3656 RepID=A0ABM3KLH1_CUCME|nr:uncharacterized protein LOC127148571 [Cucumis melo]
MDLMPRSKQDKEDVIVTSDITKPTKQDKEDDSKFIEHLEEWDSKNHQIITWLSNTSIPAIHTQFDAFENAKELWDFLSTRFKSVGLAHFYQLHNNLVNLNQEAGQSVNEYLVVLQPIWTQLDQAKISQDHLRLIKVLMGFRSEYESVRAALLHRSPLPLLDAAIQEILFEEKRLGINLTKHFDVVLASTYSPPGASSTFCKSCKLTGHKFIDCPKIECSPAKSLPPIYAADGNCMNITHIGTINAPSLNLSHTYCVPNLNFNLVSVGQLCDLGLTVSFSPNGCQVQDPQTGQTIGMGRKVGRLFEFLSLQGTLVQRSCTHTSQQNGRAERKHRHILDSSPLGNELAQFVPTSTTSDQSSISDGSSEPTPDTPPHRSTRVREPPIHLQDYHCFSTIVSLVEPTSYQEASTDPLWQKAMNDELQALEKTHTLNYVDLPPGKRPIGCKWIYKIKTHCNGTIERYKTRLVAKEYSQEYGIDYEETFASMARMTSVHSLLAVAAVKQWPLLQMDVKNAFLNGTLSEEAYMKPPPSTFSSPHKAISDLQHYLGQHFEMKDLGSLNYFLGLEVSRCSDGYLLSQAKYASDLLARSGITNSNTASTPLDPNVHLTPYDGVPHEDVSLYRQLVGSLIYLTVTRPDIVYVGHIVSQFMAAP